MIAFTHLPPLPFVRSDTLFAKKWRPVLSRFDFRFAEPWRLPFIRDGRNLREFTYSVCSERIVRLLGETFRFAVLLLPAIIILPQFLRFEISKCFVYFSPLEVWLKNLNWENKRLFLYEISKNQPWLIARFHFEKLMKENKNKIKRENENDCVAARCAWTRASSCPWLTDVSSTRWARRRVPRGRRWRSRRCSERRGPCSCCERCRYAGSWACTRSRGCSARSSARTRRKIGRRGPRWAYDASSAPSSSEVVTNPTRGTTWSFSPATSTPIVDERTSREIVWPTWTSHQRLNPPWSVKVWRNTLSVFSGRDTRGSSFFEVLRSCSTINNDSGGMFERCLALTGKGERYTVEFWLFIESRETWVKVCVYIEGCVINWNCNAHRSVFEKFTDWWNWKFFFLYKSRLVIVICYIQF